MNKPLLMSRRQSSACFNHQPRCFASRVSTIFLQLVSDAPPVNDFHDQVWEAVVLGNFVNRHRIGVQEDHFGNLDIERLDGAFDWFVEEEGVNGQDQAVEKVCDVLFRARAGLAGMASGTSSKPKGVINER